MTKPYTTKFYEKFASDCVHFLNELLKNRGLPYISEKGEFELKRYIREDYKDKLNLPDRVMDRGIFDHFMMRVEELRVQKRFADLSADDESDLVKEILKSTKCLHGD